MLATLDLSLPPSVTVAKRDLMFPSEFTDADLTHLASRVFAMRGHSKWALGAILCEMTRRRPVAPGATSTAVTEDHDATWGARYSEAMGMDPKERREIIGVYTFYPPASRTHDLSWEHYREAMWGVADSGPSQLQRALALLGEAVDRGWGARLTHFRRHIRTTTATERPATKQQDLSIAGYGTIFDFRRYAARELPNVTNYSPEQARLVLADIGDDALGFVHRLEELAASTDCKNASDARQAK